MLIYDEPLLSTQPPLSGHLLVPGGWLLNGQPQCKMNRVETGMHTKCTAVL